MDFDFIAKFSPMFVKAGILTLKLAFYGILLSIIIGFICTLIKYKRLPLLSPLVSAYIELSRTACRSWAFKFQALPARSWGLLFWAEAI